MASLGGHQEISSNSQAVETTKRPESREGSVERKASKDRDDKLKYARERQNEERQRKMEELKASAEAAQKYREQKEEERRRRIDEIRHRDTEKRNQVEERKRAIMEAEKERREYILKKNMERESRLETKKHRNSIGFAFGSSTPRLLESADFCMVSPSTFWGQRRSTSITNVAGATLSRRSSERELNDGGAKKRATSASGGTDRNENEDFVDTSHIMFRSVARRKTDLMPTIPMPRDRDGHYGSRYSLSTTPRTTPGSRSGNVTPGGHISTSRPGSAMSTSTNMSNSGYVHRRPVPAQRKPRPASIAGTGVSLDEINKLKKDNKPPVKTTSSMLSTTTSAQNTPKRTSNMMSTSLIVTSSSTRLSSAEKKTPSKREPLPQKSASASKALSKTVSTERLNKTNKDNSNNKPKEVSASMTKSMIVTTNSSTTNSTTNNSSSGNSTPVTNIATTAKEITIEQNRAEVEAKNALNLVKTEIEEKQTTFVEETPAAAIAIETTTDQTSSNNVQANSFEKPVIEVLGVTAPRSKENSVVRELTPPAVQSSDGNDMMSASMIAKNNKITTEEEAKAALAERRRLAREEAERQAELERQRVEAERLAEIQRQEEEAERQRQFEEEAMRLAEEQRRAEDERLRQAIEEAKQREEEERQKRVEDERQRVEREEAEKKAKEEAEKQRIEVAERLKREEKEREERRKRVEAIMSRTRKAGGGAPGAATTPNSTPVKEVNESGKSDAQNQQMSEDQQQQPQMQSEEITITVNSENSSTTTSGSSTTLSTTPTVAAVEDTQNTQAMYEQSVIDKENSLINSFSNMIIDENAKNLQQIEVSNGKLLHTDFTIGETILQNSTTPTTITTAVANGNGHIENLNNKNDINILQDVVAPTTNQLIDLSIESQDINNPLNFNNNNLLTTTTLVTADSHENKDISLL